MKPNNPSALAKRTAPARRAIRHLPAIAVLAIVLSIGSAIVSDFGIANDQATQISIGSHTLEWVLGESDKLLHRDFRYYGAVFELALLAAESVRGLRNWRRYSAEIFRSRYLLSHGFFLLGAFACYLLANRMFRPVAGAAGGTAVAGAAGGTAVAGAAGGKENRHRERRLLPMFAMLFYLCHPLLHGHSFYNSKDTPFLAMFMIALLLAHRALDRGSAPTHAALGAWIGLIGTIRPFAFVLLPLVALAQGGDLLRGEWRERRRIVVSWTALALAAAVAFFVALPYLWGNPGPRLAQWLAFVTDHPHKPHDLFMGERVFADDRPWSYLPVWFSITTPPLVIVLALVGGIALLATRPRDRPFEVLLAASVLVPVVAATFVGSTYDGWRHLYFVYGPTCLLACAGLAWLRRNAGRRLAALAVATLAFGVATPLVWIVRLHPHQHLYFNFLVDRKTPERLAAQFNLQHWNVPGKKALEFLLRRHPHGPIPVAGQLMGSVPALTTAERGRIKHSRDFIAYTLSDPWEYGRTGAPTLPPIYVLKVFGSTFYALTKLEVDIESAQHRTHKAAYHAALSRPAIYPPAAPQPFTTRPPPPQPFTTRPPPPQQAGRFRVHWDGRTVTYIGAECTPTDVAAAGHYDEMRPHEQNHGRFFLHVYGDKTACCEGRPAGEKAPAGLYRHNEDFDFPHRGVVFRDRTGRAGAGGGDGEGARVCMARVDLGGYRADALETGQLDAEGRRTWSARLALQDRNALGAALARLSGDEPAARGRFDVHVDDSALVYVRPVCADEDVAAAFFLHLVPFDLGGMAPAVAERGFANRDFAFDTHGAELDGACVLRMPLPPFPVREVRTGQYDRDGAIWNVAFALPQTSALSAERRKSGGGA